MERFALLLFVAHFRRRLDRETEETERRIVQKMLAGQAITDAGSARLAALELHYGKSGK